jgi:hypothetical protein
MSKHTPGPWNVRFDGKHFNIDATPTGDKPEGQSFFIGYSGMADSEANARLIAAAPEMLEMLKGAAKTMRQILRGDMMAKITHADLGDVEEVIAKAEGRTNG